MEAERLSMLVLGDSIARGDEATRPSRSFVSLFADHLHDVTGAGISVMNPSLGGYTSRDAERVQRRARPYNLLLVAVGMNDATPDRGRRRARPQVPPDEYQRRLERIVRRAGCETVLVSPCVPAAELGADVWPYRERLARIAAEHGCVFGDVTSRWETDGGDRLLANGLNHPDDAGHRIYADVLIDAWESRR